MLPVPSFPSLLLLSIATLIFIVGLLESPLGINSGKLHKRLAESATAQHGERSSPLQQRGGVAPTPSTPPHCHLIGFNPLAASSWQRNARSLCLTSSLCIRPSTSRALGHLYLGGSFANARCTHLNVDLSLAPPSAQARLNCSNLRRKVLCAHGKYANSILPQACPPVRPLAALSAVDNASTVWKPEDVVMVVVPDIPWVGNIFHFSFIPTFVSRVIADLRMLTEHFHGTQAVESGASPFNRKKFAFQDSSNVVRVAVVLRGAPSSSLGAWQATTFGATIRRRAAAANVEVVSVEALHEDYTSRAFDPMKNNAAPLCAHAGVLIGERGNVNVWPFPNGTSVAPEGNAVPAQAAAFREAIYGELQLESTLKSLRTLPTDEGGSFPSSFTFALPPLVLGYARRAMVRDLKKGSAFKYYGWRRFSDADEAWFMMMLREETEKYGVELRLITVTAETPMDEQVSMFAQVGFVVGIHGANLVNAMFAPPFASLLEITPGNSTRLAYYAGENSGLAYKLHVSTPATLEESFCGSELCSRSEMQRRVKIESKEQRIEVREKVQWGLQRLKSLHEQFPRGIPTTLSLPEQAYEINWGKSQK